MEIKKVVVTGAAGQIGYSLIFRIANGDLLGLNQKISLHLLDVAESVPLLKGLAMELEDSAFPLLHEVKIGSDAEPAFEGAQYVFLVGSKPRGPGMVRKDLLLENAHIFVTQGKAIGRVASRDVKVLVVGNPCNTNCWIALKSAKTLDPRQFFAMTRLDQNRAMFQLSHKAGVSVADVSNMAIWGNHSSTQVPDFEHAKIKEKPVVDVILDRKWLENDFVTMVQKRGDAVIAARGKSSAASAANAAIGAMKSVLIPTRQNDFFSMGMLAESNPYGIDEDLVFSFPARSQGKGNLEIVSGLNMSSFLQAKIALTQKELQEEREVIAHFVKG